MRRGHSCIVDLQEQLDHRTRERDEALKQQTAASEVLRVISSSPGDLESVFRSILVNANRICEAHFGTIFRYDGKALVVTAWEGVPPEYLALLQSGPLPVDERTATGQAAKSKQVVHIADLSAELPRTKGDQLRARLVELGGVRTILAVPMLKERQLVGAISIYRKEVRPFTDKQIELVKNFAAQAAIAIENTRLLNEQRETLERQTATSDVLKVISTSPTDVNPVFETILESAYRLCDSKLAAVLRFDGTLLHLAATKNWPAEAMPALANRFPMRPNPHLTSGRVALTKSVVIQEDTLADANYDQSFAQAGGWRRMLGVPMLREGDVFGVIVVAWQEPGLSCRDMSNSCRPLPRKP